MDTLLFTKWSVYEISFPSPNLGQGQIEFSMGDVNKPEMCKDGAHAISLVKEQQDYVMVMDRLGM